MKREKSTLREYDEKASNIISSFLDTRLYANMDNVKRIYSKKEQIKGIDIKFGYNNHYYLCDEKAAIRYINKRLFTFSLELSFINKNNEIQDGWLFDKKHINDSFLFCWIDKATKDVIESVDDLKSVTVALVKKSKIIDFLKEKGWTKEKLMYKSSLVRSNENEDKGNINKDGLKFSVSKHLVEQPVNILLSRITLLEISDLKLTFI